MSKRCSLWIPVASFILALSLSFLLTSTRAHSVRLRNEQTAFCSILPARIVERVAPPIISIPGAAGLPGGGGTKTVNGGAFNNPGGYNQSINLSRNRGASFAYISSHIVIGNTGSTTTDVQFDQDVETKIMGALGALGAVQHRHALVTVVNGNLKMATTKVKFIVTQAPGLTGATTFPRSIQTKHTFPKCTLFAGTVNTLSTLTAIRLDKAWSGEGEGKPVMCSQN